jgi:hypothetical protein
VNGRNKRVEDAVEAALGALDHFLEGGRLSRLSSGSMRHTLDAQLAHKSNSVRLASLFFTFYAVAEPLWDCSTIPTGIRGKWGDKRLATEFNLRHITLHNEITAFGENLGWKGNVSAARLKGDARFDRLMVALKNADLQERAAASEYMAVQFAATQRLIAPLPPVGDDVLTYARARMLLINLINIPSEGNIPQFLIAGLLHVHRSRFGHEIKTHHVHASDKFDDTYGDIEEFRDGALISAYEVTVRPDWKNRVTDFRAKMDAARLTKYVIFASNINSDEELAIPAKMLGFLEPYGRDIAVVDIIDAIHVFAAELTARELRDAVNQTHSYLSSPKLCGRADIIDKYAAAVSDWLDGVS